MTYRTEFPDFDPATLPEIPADWRDRSWHNETCPSFKTPRGFIVWIDYAEPADSEWPELRRSGDYLRFNVHLDGGQCLEEVFASDDWAAVLAFIAAAELLDNDGDECPITVWSRDGDGADLREASDGFQCRACGRDEHDCSADPCDDVIADREA